MGRLEITSDSNPTALKCQPLCREGVSPHCGPLSIHAADPSSKDLKKGLKLPPLLSVGKASPRLPQTI